MQNDKTECINEAVNTIKSHARRQAHNGRETKASERERRADIEMSISVCVNGKSKGKNTKNGNDPFVKMYGI